MADPTKHVLVPKHEKLSDKDKQKLLEEYSITIKELPGILITDPAIENLKVTINDIVKVTRHSHTAGETVFYRRVTNE